MIKLLCQALCALLHGHRHAIRLHEDGDRWVCSCGAETRANVEETLA